MAFKLKFSANLAFLFPEIKELPKKYEAAKASGFTAVECGGNIYDYTIDEIKTACQQNRMVQVHMNAHTGDTKGLACLPDKVDEFQRSLKLSVQYCQGLDCQMLHIMSGVYPDEKMSIGEELRHTYHDTLVKNLRYAAQTYTNTGVTFLIEPISTIPNYFMESAEQAVAIIKEVGEENVKLQLDLFHQQKQRGDLTETITKNLQHIGHIQVSQVPHRNEPDSLGEINYQYIFDLLKDIKYGGWIGCEYVPSKGLEDTFEWLKPYL